MIARGKMLDLASNGFHHTCSLMAKNHWQGQQHILVFHSDIGMTNARCNHTDTYFIWSRFCQVKLLYLKRFIGGNSNGGLNLHRCISSVGVFRPHQHSTYGLYWREFS